MKKNMRFYSIAALALTGAMTLAACSADDPTADSRQPAANDGTVTMTTTVSLADGGTTRALAADGTKTFAEGDKIAFFYENTSGQTVKAESDALDNDDIATGGQTAAFTVTLSNAKAGGTVKYVYPAAMAGTADVDYSKLATQDGKLATLASTLDCATYSDNLSATGQLPSQPQLQNQLAVLALTLYDTSVSAANDVTAKVTKVTVKVGSDAYTVNPTAAAGPVYVAVKPAANATVSYTATTSTGEYKKELTGKTYEAGYLYKLSLQMTPVITVTATDLSMLDCAGNARDKQWTANCYMVHTAGDYKLPLVYGNAIKAGQTNAAAYTGVENENTTLTFPRHDGNAITGPWIKDNGIAVTQAELLWQDAQGLVTAVGISGDYLTLTVGKDAAEQEGNALVAAKDAQGTIVWSWHIWVTKQTFATLTTITASGYGYKLTPVNLGWVGDATSATGGYNTYYQWGRKDAFIPSKPIPYTGNKPNHTVYDINNNDVTKTAFSNNDDNNMTIGGNIQHPTVHYYNSSTYGPCNTTYYNMWDAQQTSTADNTAAATVKTVYDPCPPGFCVPTIGLYNYIKSQNRPTWNTGYTYPATNGVFFPASGCRNYRKGDLGNVGTYGYCWSATPRDGAKGRYFSFYSSSWYLNTSNRTMGCPVRAVAE